jgi:hypothetical protein
MTNEGQSNITSIQDEIAKITSNFSSSDVPTLISALEYAREINNYFADAIADALEHNTERYFIYERLGHFKNVRLESKLLDIFKRTSDPNIKTMCAQALFEFGYTDVLNWLLDVIITADGQVIFETGAWTSTVVNSLSRSKIMSAAPRMIQRLEWVRHKDIDLGESFRLNLHRDAVVAVIYALKSLDRSIPKDLVDYFSKTCKAKELEAALRDL